MAFLHQDKFGIILIEGLNITFTSYYDCIHNNYKALLWMDKTSKVSK